MDGLCKRTFKGYKSLNRMQSLVYPVAYKTNENILICAPTGAGKTDAAMLAILNAISHNIFPNPMEEPDASDFVINTDDFKIVYVAPMKALAADYREAGKTTCMAGHSGPRVYWRYALDEERDHSNADHRDDARKVGCCDSQEHW